jgi:ATP/maltotriose-dependent transcriptional regulator MalT
VSDSLAELLTRGERAAFHAPPASGIPVLQQAVVEGRAAGRDAEAAMAAWLLGVCLASSGRWGSALTVLRPLMLDAGSPATAGVAVERRMVASFAASTAASVHRQLGRHADATALDSAARDLAGGSDEAAFDAAIGLAADAIGSGDPDAAGERVAEAEALVGRRSDWWRQRVRLDWAQAELALVEGRPGDAAVRASSALSRAEAAGAPRHVAKSLLFLGVALLERGDLDDAVATLRRCVTLADPLGLLPVLWPARALIGALAGQGPGADAAAAAAAVRDARTTVRALADDLPDDPPERLRSTWLAREDVAAVLATP